jgi:hypothetical protein
MRTQRLVSKLGVAVLVASIAGAVLLIEHGHRIDIATSTGVAFAAPVVAACPENENRPPSADCIVFMQGAVASGARAGVSAAANAPAAPADAPDSAEPPGPACPHNNENVPYSAKCLRFLSGWFWRANPAEGAAAASAYAPQ